MHMHIHQMMYMQAHMQMLHATATATSAIAATAVTLLQTATATDTGGHSNGHVTATCDTDFDRWGQARAIHPISRWRGRREDIDRSPIFDRPHRTYGHVHVVEVATIDGLDRGGDGHRGLQGRAPVDLWNPC